MKVANCLENVFLECETFRRRQIYKIYFLNVKHSNGDKFDTNFTFYGYPAYFDIFGRIRREIGVLKISNIKKIY